VLTLTPGVDFDLDLVKARVRDGTNIKGQRFSFVRFQEVVDADVLKRRLNAIWIGTWKVRVNKPKYRRSQGSRQEWNGTHRPTQQKREWRQKEPHQKYAHALGRENGQKRAQTMRNEDDRNAQGVKEPVSVHFRVEEEDTKWLKNCFIGKVADARKVQTVKESFLMEWFDFIRVGYLGGLCMLLSGQSEEVLQKSIEENKELFAEILNG